MVAKARVFPSKTAPRAPPQPAPTPDPVLNVQAPRSARPEMSTNSVAPETTTMAMIIIGRRVALGPRWAHVAIALGNPRAPPSHRLHEKDVPVERPVDDVLVAPVFDNVGTEWQQSRRRRADCIISLATLWPPSPVPPIPRPPKFVLRFYQTSPVTAPRL